MQFRPRRIAAAGQNRELRGIGHHGHQPCHLHRAAHRPVNVHAEQPGHPSRQGAPDLLAQPVDTRERADGRSTGAHHPIVAATTDNTRTRSADPQPASLPAARHGLPGSR
ncbi:hypothetical protein AB0C90_34135 [Streptomyces sp. NPDC048550]|uniref:hypothetical protein n=1 Tax=Streptomyces sp. NPDC048550 TaxID=3155739 RepID=UPI003416B2DF